VLAVREEAALLTLASPRRKGISRGAKLMFLSVVLLPIFLALGFLVEGPVPLLFPFAIFLAGLSVMLYTRIFGEDVAPLKSQPPQPSGLGTMLGRATLPPASNIRMKGVGEQPVRTAELVKPPSVTEHTTKLLDSD